MKRVSVILPVLFGFFIMGFCDVAGISTSYVQSDFGLSETVSGLVPSMVFVWFLLLSVPAAMAMNRTGRKNMVLLSNAVTIAGMMLPLIHYSLASCMAAFLMLGIGNTMLQVSLNPLMTNVVKGNALASSLTAGQVVKAISSFSGPFIAAFAAIYLGNWKYMFPIFAVITLVSTVWLCLTPIREEAPVENASTLGAALGLLRRSVICRLFLGIFFIVGIDVGINTLAPKLMMARCGMALHQAGFASGVYFVCRTAGALLGTILLARVSGSLYFRINIVAALAVMCALPLLTDAPAILAAIGLTGFLCSSIFTIIYARALDAAPDRENEVSGLMTTGIVGGAVIPPLMGAAADAMGSLTGSVAVLVISAGYLVFLSFCRTAPSKR